MFLIKPFDELLSELLVSGYLLVALGDKATVSPLMGCSRQMECHKFNGISFHSKVVKDGCLIFAPMNGLWFEIHQS